MSATPACGPALCEACHKSPASCSGVASPCRWARTRWRQRWDPSEGRIFSSKMAGSAQEQASNKNAAFAGGLLFAPARQLRPRFGRGRSKTWPLLGNNWRRCLTQHRPIGRSWRGRRRHLTQKRLLGASSVMSKSKTNIKVEQMVNGSKLGQVRPDFGRNRPNLNEVCQQLTNIDKFSTNTWPNATAFGRRCWTRFGICRPSLIDVGPSLANTGQAGPNFGSPC